MIGKQDRFNYLCLSVALHFVPGSIFIFGNPIAPYRSLWAKISRPARLRLSGLSKILLPIDSYQAEQRIWK